MGLIWSQNLSTGLEWQDKEHIELFKTINSLLDAMKQHKGQEQLDVAFKFLDAYVIKHFRGEEAAMEKHNYSERSGHLEQHKKFIKNIEYLKDSYKKQTSVSILVDAQKLLADWFYDHVAKIDKKLGSFLTDKK